jgi:hypothetical protein
MVNHSGVHPNLRTVCRRIGYRVHLLLVATTDVNPNEEFFFDYVSEVRTRVVDYLFCRAIGIKIFIRHRPLCTYIVAAPNLAPDTLKFVAFGMAWPNLVVKTKSSEKIVYYPRPHFGHVIEEKFFVRIDVRRGDE